MSGSGQVGLLNAWVVPSKLVDKIAGYVEVY